MNIINEYEPRGNFIKSFIINIIVNCNKYNPVINA